MKKRDELQDPPEHGNIGESREPTTIGVGHIGETPETELPVGGGARPVRIDDRYSEITAGELGLWTTSAPGARGGTEEAEGFEEGFEEEAEEEI